MQTEDQSASGSRRPPTRCSSSSTSRPSPRWPTRPRAMAVVDNTFMTPVFQRPLELGADLVVHSTTKYLNGHSDVVGGFRAPTTTASPSGCASCRTPSAACPAPMDCFLVLRGVKTLHVRMAAPRRERASSWSSSWPAHPEIERVTYPGLASHPQHALARAADERLRRHVDLRAQGAAWKRRGSFLGAVQRLRLRRVAGRRRVAHRAPGDHDPRLGAQGDPRAAGHLTTASIRVSAGIEDKQDLWDDLSEALAA